MGTCFNPFSCHWDKISEINNLRRRSWLAHCFHGSPAITEENMSNRRSQTRAWAEGLLQSTSFPSNWFIQSGHSSKDSRISLKAPTPIDQELKHRSLWRRLHTYTLTAHRIWHNFKTFIGKHNTGEKGVLVIGFRKTRIWVDLKH